MKSIKIISSKSDVHRALICNFLAEDSIKVHYKGLSEDILATKNCLENLKEKKKDLYPKESGSTFRFLIPVVGALKRKVLFHLEGRLSERPLSPLKEELEKKGMILGKIGENPYSVSGNLRPGIFTLRGDVSSQFISGLLFSLPLLEKDSEIRITGDFQSKAYVDMTVKTLREFNIQIIEEEKTYKIPGNQKYFRSEDYYSEGDWSNAAFWFVAGCFLEEGLEVTGFSNNSLQGDKKILEIIKNFGGVILETEDGFSVKKGKLKGITIDARQIPDLIPILSLLGAVAIGETEIINAERLRLKESDRLKKTIEILKKLGIKTEEKENGFIIFGNGGKKFKNNTFESHADHRLVMTVAIASINTEGVSKLKSSQAVNKSYPSFFEELEALGLDENLKRR